MVRPLILLLALCCFLGCNTSKPANKKVASPKEALDDMQGSPEVRLAKILQRIGGVQVTDRGGQYSVLIRGGFSSFDGNVPPLFVVNRQPIGRDFNSAAQAIGSNEINSIRVLKDSDASIYGVRGASGVIEIRTKML
jgi:TonB-dependent SusC/RagA subfamily outer membrane receptor